MRLRFFFLAVSLIACGESAGRGGEAPDMGVDMGPGDMGVDMPAPDLGPMDMGDDFGPPVTISYTCEPGVGLDRPLEACTREQRCGDLEELTFGERVPEVEALDRPSELPNCESSVDAILAGRFEVDDGAPRMFDIDGVERHACQAIPLNVDPGRPQGLMIFLHGLGGNAADAYELTGLRGEADLGRLGPLGTPPGFFFVSLQARNVHGPNGTDGTHWDHSFRDLYAEEFAGDTANPDVRFIDRVIDAFVAEYPDEVDPERIYLVGWDDGGEMALFYGLYRHENPTAGGNRVAANATGGAKDPFVGEANNDETCDLAALPASAVPTLYITRSCDTVACDASQLFGLNRGTPVPLPPGSDAEAFFERLETEAMNENSQRVILGPSNRSSPCASTCFRRAADDQPERDASRLHLRWIDDVGESSTLNDFEPEIINFFAANPLPIGGPPEP
ncbi:MAG: hypothetical protein AAGH15_08770 [Myxococcota bacterium]